MGQLGGRESVEQHREAHVRVCSVVAEAIVQGIYNVPDVVCLEVIEKNARRSSGASKLLAGVCDWLRHWAETPSLALKSKSLERQ